MQLLSMSWTSIFYWLTLSDGIKGFFNVTSDIFTVLAVVSFVVMMIMKYGAATISSNNLKNPEDEQNDPDLRAWNAYRVPTTKIFYLTLTLALFTWLGYVAVPSKRDCMFIIAGSTVAKFITTDSSAKAIPSDITNFFHAALKEKTEDLSIDTKKALGVATPKDDLLDKAKDLTRDQLIDLIKNDTTIFNKK